MNHVAGGDEDQIFPLAQHLVSADFECVFLLVEHFGIGAERALRERSEPTCQLLGFIDRGTTMVRVEYVGPAQIDGSDDRLLEATLRQDEPAPAPGSVRLAAATRIVPVAMTSPSRTRFASTGSIGGNSSQFWGK